MSGGSYVAKPKSWERSSGRFAACSRQQTPPPATAAPYRPSPRNPLGRPSLSRALTPGPAGRSARRPVAPRGSKLRPRRLSPPSPARRRAPGALAAGERTEREGGGPGPGPARARGQGARAQRVASACAQRQPSWAGPGESVRRRGKHRRERRRRRRPRRAGARGPRLASNRPTSPSRVAPSRRLAPSRPPLPLSGPRLPLTPSRSAPPPPQPPPPPLPSRRRRRRRRRCPKRWTRRGIARLVSRRSSVPRAPSSAGGAAGGFCVGRETSAGVFCPLCVVGRRRLARGTARQRPHLFHVPVPNE